ncbi:recombinase family protein [Kosakonia sacchari]|uniref:recombinase family protein n=1 Tax=Kosakonia sacchari TaxID=1158459 RepID=UPI000BE5D188|nr:recombinase family protein [Kosakonia sacchari]PDO82717.1 hypothetical protein BK797_18755 [Kosakonia sacchari]
MKSYLYSRISTLQQVAGFGIERQIQTVQDFLKYAVLDERLGYQLDPDDFELLESDLGKSAFHGRNWLPGASLGNFYIAVIEGHIMRGALIVENIDRLVRQTQYQALEKLITLINRGIDIVEVETSAVFSAKIPDSIMMLNMSVTRAHQESKRKSNMATKSWKNRIEGYATGTKIKSHNLPEWLSVVDNKYVVDEELAAKFRKVFQLYSTGIGAAEIVRKTGWPTVRVHLVLRDTRLIGRMTVGKKRGKGKEEVFENIFPCVIDKELFAHVQVLINSNEATNKQRATTKTMGNIFKGISRCPYCKEVYVTISSGGVKPGWKQFHYFNCLGRRHSKNGVCKPFSYTIIEKTLLTYIKGIDWAKVYAGDTDTTVIDLLRNKIVVIETTIKELESELVNADDEEVLALVRVLKKKKAERDSINQELIGLSTQHVAELDYDISDVCNRDNVQLRVDVNVALRKVIRCIWMRKVDSIVIARIDYYTDIACHYLVIDASTGDLLNFATVDSELMIRSNLMDLNLITGEETRYPERANEWDQIVWNTIEEVFANAFEQAKQIRKS